MSRIDELIEQIECLEEQTRVEFDKKRSDFHSVIDARRLGFSTNVTQLHRESKTGLFSYVSGAAVLSVLTAPIIYLGFLPLFLLDLFLFVYQLICFPIYRIPKVERSEYVYLDRGDLPYLNFVERFNCFYCGYANGVAGYFTEVAARTEQYWCPIKHARRIQTAHDRYPMFFEYGDAESYRLGLERLRDALAKGEEARQSGTR